MDWKNQLTKTPYLVLFIVLITIGVGTASALITITLAGNVNITGDADIDGNLNVDGAITGVETLEGLNCSIDQIAKFDGSNWVCKKLIVKNNPITVLDSTDVVGQYTSIAIGIDNNPVISFYDATNGDLKLVQCNNISCSVIGLTTTLDSADEVGRYTSIAIGADNNPVISYYDITNSGLKVVHCGNITCSSENTVTTLDSSDDFGRYTSIAIGSDNLPVISYRDDSNAAFKVLHCGNITCSSGNTKTTVDSDNVGTYTSIAIGADNNPVISYFDFINRDLKVLHCGNITCSSGNTKTTLDSADGVGRYTSIAIGADNNPVISYYDLTNKDLKLVVDGVVLIFE